MLKKLVQTEQHDPDTMQSINPPLVSIVMVICNVERFLAEAIESVLSQTFRDFEFIIVDFGSIDKSKDIAASYAVKDGRIKLSEIPPCSYIEAKIAACSLPVAQSRSPKDQDPLMDYGMSVRQITGSPTACLL
jgi:cellulose synthase/poly-beta-1,6-N-acetylglucosamine synthase-like glycosyltransferase